MIPVNNKLVLDFETYSPGLNELGPRFIQGEHHVIGIGVKTDLGHRAYYPIGHFQDNVDHQPVVYFLTEFLSNPANTVIMHNAQFDMECAWSLGMEIKCQVYDTMVNFALIDEESPRYDLGATAEYFGAPVKKKAFLESFLPKKPRSKKPDWDKLRELPTGLVAEYAESDLDATWGVYEAQQPILAEQGLLTVSRLESDLAPVLWDMRRRGVRVDLDAAEIENRALLESTERSLKQIREEVPGLNPFSPLQLAQTVRKLGYTPPETQKGADSVPNTFLRASGHPLLLQIAEYRDAEKIRRDFVQGMILGTHYKGRLHPNWFATRGAGRMSGDDIGGTRSGRLACSNPNLAQIPSRHPVLGPLVRSLFLPDEGLRWWKGDASQQEPRIGIHFAYLTGMEGAAEARQKYLDDTALDFHAMTMEMVNQVRDKPITRSQTKAISLGSLYGLGKAKMMKQLGVGPRDAEQIIADYHQGFPWVRQLLRYCGEIAERRGYVKTVLGRRRRFNLWEPRVFEMGKFPLPYDEAVKVYGTDIRKAGLHRALNSIIQGSAAEMCKVAMVNAHREGFQLLVSLYDELGASMETEEEGKRLADIFENAIKFEVPQHVEWKLQDNWDE